MINLTVHVVDHSVRILSHLCLGFELVPEKIKSLPLDKISPAKLLYCIGENFNHFLHFKVTLSLFSFC